jgi:peroxiredoxin
VKMAASPQFLSCADASTRTRNYTGPSSVTLLILIFIYYCEPRHLRARDTRAAGSDLETQLAALESSWARLAETRATGEIDRLLADTYFIVDATGIVRNRQTYLADLKSGKLHVESWAIEDSTTHVVGDTAVVSATVGIIGEYQQRDLNGFYRITDTLVRQKDGWRVLSRQQTKIASRTDPLSERVGKPNGKPRIVLFVQGSFCPHCMAQLSTFARELSKRKCAITVVSADTEEDLRKFPDVPFTLVADPQHKLFRKFGAFIDGPMHATLALDGKGVVVFRTVGKTPFMMADVITEWVERAAATNTARSSDDSGR